jgi:hypothetical protein
MIRPTFLSSCFNYYNNVNQYSTSFLEKYRNIIIIDYANVIHILFNTFRDIHQVSGYFYNFLLRHLRLHDKIIIVSKKIVLDKVYDILDILSMGQTITQQWIDPSVFKKEQLCIYNLEFEHPISTSIDDLLQYFLTFIMFMLHVDKVILLTNDKQTFDKHLFGKTNDEVRANITYLKDLTCTHVVFDKKYKLHTNPMEQSLLRSFFHSYMTETITDVDHLECNLIVLLEWLQHRKPTGKLIHPHGYNSTFKKSSFTKSKLPSFSYSNLNRLQKKKSMKCKVNQTIDSRHQLKHNYYLYAFIKYMQMYQHSIQYKGKWYGDFFGNWSQEQILYIIADYLK